MAAKWCKTGLLATLILAVPALLAVVSVGCSAPGIGLNPYDLLSKIDAVDHTNFFVETYDSLIGAGLTNFTEEDVQALEEAQNEENGGSNGTGTSNGE